MKLNHLKIRVWLALAVAIASLGLASSASARLYTGDLGGPECRSCTTRRGHIGRFQLGRRTRRCRRRFGGSVRRFIGLAYPARNRTRLAT